jgi:hypothetical protein
VTFSTALGPAIAACSWELVVSVSINAIVACRGPSSSSTLVPFVVPQGSRRSPQDRRGLQGATTTSCSWPSLPLPPKLPARISPPLPLLLLLLRLSPLVPVPHGGIRIIVVLIAPRPPWLSLLPARHVLIFSYPSSSLLLTHSQPATLTTTNRKRKGQQTDLDVIAPLASKRSRRNESIQLIDSKVSPSLPSLSSPVPHSPVASTSALTLDHLPPEPVLPPLASPPATTIIHVDENEAAAQPATPLQDLPLPIDVDNNGSSGSTACVDQLDLDTSSPPPPITPPRLPNYFSPLSQSFTSDDLHDGDDENSLLITPLHPHGSYHRTSTRVYSTKRVSPRLWQFACKQRVGMLSVPIFFFLSFK